MRRRDERELCVFRRYEIECIGQSREHKSFIDSPEGEGGREGGGKEEEKKRGKLWLKLFPRSPMLAFELVV
jgi:hypothetical protein